MENNQINSMIKKIVSFRNARNWAQFHDGKNLAMSLSIESSELLELFLWKEEKEVSRQRIKEELADVFYSALLIADRYALDVVKIVESKLRKNAKKYPVKKFKGVNKKYTEI